MTAVPHTISNRRRRIRHKVLTPAYASFTRESKSMVLDLNEIVDISQDGVAIQCNTSLELNKNMDLCLDLAESSGPIYTTGKVIWSSSSGRAGFRFSDLAPTSLLLLREWLFLNAMAGAASAQSDAALEPKVTQPPTPFRPNYTDTLATLGAVRREVDALGSDLVAALKLIATRAETLLRASGCAIALASDVPDVMVCRASSGDCAPPVGTKLQVGTGFSGECVRSDKLLRCDDAETDLRVDADSCRSLGIRSILAAPLNMANKVIGIIEVFSPSAHAFTEDDSTTLRRLAEAVTASVSRAAQSSPSAPSTRVAMAPSPGSILFASSPPEPELKEPEEKSTGGIKLPLSQLIVLLCAPPAIFLALGFVLGPWIQEKVKSVRPNLDHTVLAASRPLLKASNAVPTAPLSEAEVLNQVRNLAKQGDSSAQYSLGRRYNLGDGVKQDYAEAANWFMLAADHGHVLAQGALGDYYNYGHGVTVDLSKAYFWSYLASSGGDEVSKLRLGRLAGQLPHSQLVQIQQQAETWFHEHQKPTPTR